MFALGPYEFTRTDAERTLANVPDIWRELASGRDGAVVEALRPDTTGDLGEALARTWDAMLAVGPALRAAGRLPARAEGTVAQLNASRGGVPKQPVAMVDVGWRGVHGDTQHTRVHHGRPWQALCLWSTEVIDELNTEGHRLFPGAAGENITLTGLSWADVRPGVRMRIGTVLCDITAFSAPCKKNAQWFADGDFAAMGQERGPVSRVYATVLEPGRIVTGDAAILEP